MDPPPIQWQRVYGHHEVDDLNAMEATKDGGLVLAGYSLSFPQGDKTSPWYGSGDFWVVRLDPSGNILWDGSYGGSLTDAAWAIRQTLDGGFIIGGDSLSDANGSKTSPHQGTEGNTDYDGWLVRIDADGEQLWDYSLGGNRHDFIPNVIPTRDNGFLVCAASESGVSGNKTLPNLGGIDAWLIKLNAQGSNVWEHVYGGGGTDFLVGAIQSPNGDFILAGRSSSFPGDKKISPHIGEGDFWAMRLDTSGNRLWERSYGGTKDEDGCMITALKDGTFLIGGMSASNADGNKTTANIGAYDFWIIQIDGAGNKLWEATLGGTEIEHFRDLVATRDGGFALGGFSRSEPGGSKTSPHYGRDDYWVVRFSEKKNILWDASYGGSEADQLEAMAPGLDGGLWLGGSSVSGINGNKTIEKYAPERSTSDYWVIKLPPDRVHLHSAQQSKSDIREAGFHLQLTGPSNVYVLERSSNLLGWAPFATNHLSNYVDTVIDRDATTPRRFYRARTTSAE
jgi:hypothetical protein